MQAMPKAPNYWVEVQGCKKQSYPKSLVYAYYIGIWRRGRARMRCGYADQLSIVQSARTALELGANDGSSPSVRVSRRNVNCKYFTFSGFYEPVAQQVTQLTFNQQTESSNLSRLTNNLLVLDGFEDAPYKRAHVVQLNGGGPHMRTAVPAKKIGQAGTAVICIL